MDDKINIVKAPAPVIYTPQEVASIFKEQLKTPAKVVTIEGVYRQNPKSGNYYGYFYDSLAAQNDNFEMTLVVPAALRDKMKDGTLVQVSGVVSKELRNRCSIDLHFHVTRYDVIEENVISEDEQRLMSLQAEKSARGYRNVDGVLEAKLFRGEKPNICLLFARGTITDQDFKKGLEAARSHIDFVEENETFAQISQLRAKLGQLDRMGYDVIAIVRGGGSGIREVFDMPDLIESVVNLSTPFVTGVGHPGEKPFIAKVADKDLGTPSLLGVYFKDLVNRVIDQREKSKAVLVVSAFLHFPPFATLCKPTTCEILFRETNPKRDKNGTKSQENKIKNASSPTSLVVDFSFLCKGTILSREKQAKSSKYAAYQTFILHVHFQEDTASASCTDLCCLLQRPVKIRFMPFVHYGIAADAHCLGTVYNPSAIICNAEICVPSANW